MIRWWKVRPDVKELVLEDLDELLSERTRLVAVTHVSNVLGAIHPIREIARRTHAVGARICVDGVAYAPHRAIDVQALDVDYYAFSFYKVYGPHLAALWIRESLFEELAPVNHYFIGRDQLPAKMEPGGVCYELAASLPAIVDYLCELGSTLDRSADTRSSIQSAFERIAEREEPLQERLLAWLRGNPNFRIIGPAQADRKARVPTVSFVREGMSSSTIAPRGDAADVAFRFGHFYAKRLIDALDLGPDGVVRVSLVHYNTQEEVDRVIGVLDGLGAGD